MTSPASPAKATISVPGGSLILSILSFMMFHRGGPILPSLVGLPQWFGSVSDPLLYRTLLGSIHQSASRHQWMTIFFFKLNPIYFHYSWIYQTTPLVSKVQKCRFSTIQYFENILLKQLEISRDLVIHWPWMVIHWCSHPSRFSR